MDYFGKYFNEHPASISIAVAGAYLSVAVMGLPWPVAIIVGIVGFFLGKKSIEIDSYWMLKKPYDHSVAHLMEDKHVRPIFHRKERLYSVAGRSKRENAFKLLQEYGFTLALIIDLILITCYGYFKIDYSIDNNLIIGKFVVIVISGFAAPASLIAFLTVIVTPKKHWGEVEMLKTHIGIGSLMGLIAAVVVLIKAFKAAI